MRDRVASAKDWSEEMIDIRKEIVDFHGEMVLLENYSALNYTGTVQYNFSCCWLVSCINDNVILTQQLMIKFNIVLLLFLNWCYVLVHS